MWFHSLGIRAIRPQLGLAIPRIGHPIGGHLGGWHRELESLHPITPICLPIRSQRRARRAQGFGPNSEVRTASSEDGGKDLEGPAQVGPNDRFVAGVVHGKSGGIGTFVAVGQSGQVTLQYQFGRQAKGPQ